VQEGSRRAIVAAFGANFGIAAAKFVGFAATGSASMLAEAVHSVADTGNQGLLLLGGRRARREATPEHPFGFGRERYFWSFVVALVLFTLGGAFALVEGIDKLRHPHAPESLWWAISILAIAIALETLSFRTAIAEANHERGRTRWLRFLQGAKSPELPIVLLEDSGALVGLAFALAGVVLAKVTGNARWDAAGSLAIGALLCAVAGFLAIEMKGLLIGEAATPEMEEAIVSVIRDAPRVRRIIHLRTEHLGPDEVLLAAKVEYDHDLSVAELAAAIDGTEALVRARVPEARTIYIEPDIHRS
jgi:cation diffusion facilitator family transporter